MVKLLRAIFILCLLFACSVPLESWGYGGKGSEIKDPLEPFNRVMFGIHRIIDAVVLSPVTHFYKGMFPPPVQMGLRNVHQNLKEPAYAVNNLLQGRSDSFVNSIKRFGINSTLGVAGIFDVAGKNGIERHKEDFGQTLGRWGVGFGPYLFIPVLGTSSFRDVLGTGVDTFLHPATYFLDYDVSDWYIANSAQSVVAYADIIDDYEKVIMTSVDPYTMIKSLYYQNRQARIHDQSSEFILPEIEELEEDF